MGLSDSLRPIAWCLCSKIPCMAIAPTPQARPRSDFKIFRNIDTRWADNDVYGHVNNVAYYSWFDTAVNAHLIEQGALDIVGGETIGLVVQSQCHYFAPLAFPQKVAAGLRVGHVGNSSVRYEIGLFAEGEPMSAAHGHFVHVYVDRSTRRPRPLSAVLRTVVNRLSAEAA
jgi:acyl-CoA thioester hydrolase